MLTCNKNFVDRPVWILRSWTCTKLNIMLHQSLEEEESQETGSDRDRPVIITPSDQTGLNRSELDLTGLVKRVWTEPQQTDVCLCEQIGSDGGSVRSRGVGGVRRG